MYLKLSKIQERTAGVIIEIDPAEIHYEIITDIDSEGIDRHLAFCERNGYEPRRFLHWPWVGKTHANGDEHGLLGTQPRVLEITIAGKHPQVIMTNYDAFLLNRQGEKVQRLFRYMPPDVVEEEEQTTSAVNENGVRYGGPADAVENDANEVIRDGGGVESEETFGPSPEPTPPALPA